MCRFERYVDLQDA